MDTSPKESYGTQGRLSGLKAVVTGSGGFMGGAVAMRFAREGADIVLNDRRPGTTDDRESEIRAMGRDAISVVTNVTRRAGAEAVIGAAIERWGRIDILANIVGGIKGPMAVPLWEVDEEYWDFTLGINLRGTFHCTQVAAPAMIERRYGKIVNIASVAWGGDPALPFYAAAKAGVVAFTSAAANHLAQYNINVNAIAPGNTQRDPTIAAGLPNANPIRVSDRDSGFPVPPAFSTGGLGRENTPDDIANAALFLCSEESRNITGQLITVAGGLNPRL